jgi:hypothetical protein
MMRRIELPVETQKTLVYNATDGEAFVSLHE